MNESQIDKYFFNDPYRSYEERIRKQMMEEQVARLQHVYMRQMLGPEGVSLTTPTQTKPNQKLLLLCN